jgi:hypothetical protein
MALPSASTPWLVDLTAVLSDVRFWRKAAVHKPRLAPS